MEVIGVVNANTLLCSRFENEEFGHLPVTEPTQNTLSRTYFTRTVAFLEGAVSKHSQNY